MKEYIDLSFYKENGKVIYYVMFFIKSIPIDIVKHIDICQSNYYLFEMYFEKLTKRKENEFYESSVTFFIEKTTPKETWERINEFILLKEII